jgi:hypothetical protein
MPAYQPFMETVKSNEAVAVPSPESGDEPILIKLSWLQIIDEELRICPVCLVNGWKNLNCPVTEKIGQVTGQVFLPELAGKFLSNFPHFVQVADHLTVKVPVLSV